MQFLEISDISDLDSILDKSKVKPQIIFKHSTICPISRISYEKMKKEYPLAEDEADVYFVGVIEQRTISNQIAEMLNVKHESPQIMVIRDGKAIYDESHLMIDPKILSSILNSK